MKELIATTVSNHNVYFIQNDQHMLAHSDVKIEHIREAVSQCSWQPPFGFVTIDLGRPVGLTHLITTGPDDDIRFEARPGRETLSRMVYGRRPESTSLITIGICVDDDGLNTVFTAFYGELSPKEPSDPSLKEEEREESETFWATHALIPV